VDVCDECGFEYDELPENQIGRALRTLPAQYGTVLAVDAAMLRAHPIAGAWSALEYACHVRDVLQVQRERVEQALVEDEPSFASMDREERVWRDRYNEQDPIKVEQQLTVASRALADLFDRLTPAQLARTAVYNYPTKAVRTLGWIGRHTVHEARHHLRDMEHVIDAVTPST
jgi:DNA segregation ATPase FtsK/SpoIIIE, S-DNA-T family